LRVSNGALFSSAFTVGDIFLGDNFQAYSPDFNITNFDFSPNEGATALSVTPSRVPEPDSLALILAGLGAFASIRWSSHRRRTNAAAAKAQEPG